MRLLNSLRYTSLSYWCGAESFTFREGKRVRKNHFLLGHELRVQVGQTRSSGVFSAPSRR